MSRILSVSVPTFILKKIDPEQLIEKYNSGEYRTCVIQKENVQVKHVIKIIGNNVQDPIYSCRDKNNIVHTIATTNCEQYEHRGSDEHLCEWCRVKFTHPIIGIPLTYKYNKTPDSSEYTLVFYTEGQFCDFSCALAYLYMCRGPSLRYYDTTYNDSETLLRMWHSKAHPENMLRPSPHYRLHKRNGGSLDDHEYYNHATTYVKIPGLITMPAKQQYIKMASS